LYNPGHPAQCVELRIHTTPRMNQPYVTMESVLLARHAAELVKRPNAGVNLGVAALDLREPEEKDESHRRLKELKDAMHQHPIPERAVARPAAAPVEGEERAAGDRDEDSRHAPEEHDNLDEPYGFSRILLHHVEQRVVIGIVPLGLEPAVHVLPDAGPESDLRHRA